jgi:zinc and cadmium transporter
MMHPLDIHWVYTFGSVALVSAASFMGMVALSWSPHKLSRVIPPLLSLAAGALLGTAFGHLLPESIERVGVGRKLSALLLAGFLTFFIIERLLGVWLSRPGGGEGLHQHHHHGPLPPADGVTVTPAALANHPMITNLLIGAAIHSFMDGMAIGTAYSTGTHLGLITTTAVLFHEAPHHIGDVSILIHKGVPVRQAVGLSLLAGGAAALGGLLVLLVGTQTAGFATVLLPFTTANFLYIAASNLMPELQHERGLRPSLAQMALFAAGSSLMFLSAGS